ncbi:ABC transporter permease subunit, partial [Rhizobium leguminosarum]|uniref:ABC transporter permease subunit n=1 Tax=Rhizobium leguminosarum TaxID=384 RepID=UPI003F94BC60
AMIEQLKSDVATAARARVMPEGIVFWRHVLPNSLVPTINLLAVNIGWLIGGTVVAEIADGSAAEQHQRRIGHRKDD